MPQRNVKASVEVDVDAGILNFQFATGETIQASLDDLEPGVVRRLALHGLEQKLRDSYAGAEPEEAFGLAAKVWDSLLEGTWARRVPAEERGETGTRLLARAIQRLAADRGRQVELATVEAQLASLSKSDRAKLRNVPAVAAAIAAIKQEMGRTSSADSLLNSLIA